jgi:hypothetical protein
MFGEAAREGGYFIIDSFSKCDYGILTIPMWLIFYLSISFQSRECLETKTNRWLRKHRNLHSIRLKTVVLEPYLGNMPHVNFAKFFVLNARVLESMTFHIEARFNNGKFLERQHHKLELEKKASRDARFHFTTAASCQHAAWNTKELRDLGLNDPFICRC